MIKNIRHTGIVTAELEPSLHFYRDLLGFTITKEMEEGGPYIDNMSGLDNVAVKTIKMAAPDGALIELLHFQSHLLEKRPRNFNDIGIAHMAFTVEDLDEAYNQLKSAGVPFSAPPQLSPDGYAKVTFCRAPEGTYIELVQVLQ